MFEISLCDWMEVGNIVERDCKLLKRWSWQQDYELNILNVDTKEVQLLELCKTDKFEDFLFH